MSTFKCYSKLYSFLERRNRLFHQIAILFLLTAICLLDQEFDDADLFIFYVSPIFLASWFVGQKAGILTSVIAFMANLLGTQDAVFKVHSPGWPRFWHYSAVLFYLLMLGVMFAALRKKYDQVNCLAMRDPLTRAYNRHGLEEMLEPILANAARHRRPLSVALFDLDDFKRINDRQGHKAGDRLLCRLVATIRANIRGSDLIARIGGDEFLILFPETCGDDAWQLLDRLRKILRDDLHRFEAEVTFSAGLVTYDSPPRSWDEVVQRVDALMYRVKSEGKGGTLREVTLEAPDRSPA